MILRTKNEFGVRCMLLIIPYLHMHEKICFVDHYFISQSNMLLWVIQIRIILLDNLQYKNLTKFFWKEKENCFDFFEYPG